MKLRIVADNHTVQHYKYGVLYTNFKDQEPYTSGYFRFRTVNNRMTVDNFKVYKVREVK